MRKFLSLAALLTFVLGLSSFGQANLKLGHINKQDLIISLPEYDSAMVTLDRSAKQLQDALEQMQVEFNKKYEEYMKTAKDLNDLIRSNKETELQEMNQRIQNFQAKAEEDIQNQRTKLLKPVLDKVTNAINDVAKENKFTYIFDITPGSTVIFQSADSQDIMGLVKKKMGVQ
jgi:outer membrane protein